MSDPSGVPPLPPARPPGLPSAPEVSPARPQTHEQQSARSGWRATCRRVESFFKVVARGSLTAGERLPPGVRGVAGVSLMIGGVLGFLPVLGFWMFPAGVALLSLDVPPLRRRLDRWLSLEGRDDAQ